MMQCGFFELAERSHFLMIALINRALERPFFEVPPSFFGEAFLVF